MATDMKCPFDAEHCDQMARAGCDTNSCPINQFDCSRFHTAIRGMFRGHKCPYDGKYCAEFVQARNCAVFEFECPNPLKDCARRVQKTR